MSLLIFGVGSKIGQGIVRKFYQSGNFKTIVCADLFPAYRNLKDFFKFREQLDTISSNVTLKDIKISERQDLYNAIQGASHIVYVTHNYYSLVPSKLNLIKTTAQLAKQNSGLERLIAVTPVELDNYFESDPFGDAIKSETQAREEYPNLTLIKSDLTIGSYSSFVHYVAKRLSNNQSLQWKPSQSNEFARPLIACDLADIVVNAMSQNQTKGKQYLAQGPKQQTLDEILEVITQLIGTKPQTGFLENIISPGSDNILSEEFYESDYRNFVRLIQQYRTLNTDGYENISTLKSDIRGLDRMKEKASINRNTYEERDSVLVQLLKARWY